MSCFLSESISHGTIFFHILFIYGVYIMKRLILLCAIVLSLGMAGTASAEQFGIFDSSSGLSENLAASFTAADFIDFSDFPGMLNQYLYSKVLFASDAAIAAGGYLTAQAAEWNGNVSGQSAYNFWDLLFYSGSTPHIFQDLLAGLFLYSGDGLEYTPAAALDTLLIDGGTYFAAITLPGSGNVIDAVFALSGNPMGLRATPAPAAVLLLGSGLCGIIALRRRVKN